jgi:Fibronectin type III domain
MAKVKPIKASLGFKKVAAGDVASRAHAVLDGLFADKDDYATPPMDQATFKGQIDALSAAMAAALDGGKKAIAAREHQKEVVIKSMRQLGHYAEETCKDDMNTFLKSGFQAASTTRASAQPLSDWIRKIVPGKNSGQMLVSIIAHADALAYQLRWASVGQGGALGNWTEIPVGKTKPAMSVTGLVPGTTYAFQVRAQTNSGYTDWSDSVTKIST